MDKEPYSNPLKGEERHKYYREHILQYAFLFVAFVFALAFLFQVREFFWRLVGVAALSVFYLVFGIWHHTEEKNLTSKHVLEYLLVAAIIFVVLFSAFLQ